MKIKPMSDYVLVKRAEEETMTPGGLYIPGNAQGKSIRAEVLAVGPGKTLNTGILLAPSLKSGDLILLNQYGGQEVEIDGEKLVLVKEDQILAVYE